LCKHLRYAVLLLSTTHWSSRHRTALLVGVSFDADVLQLLHGAVAVVEEELFAGLDGPFREDADAMVAVHHHHLCVAVGVHLDNEAAGRQVNYKYVSRCVFCIYMKYLLSAKFQANQIKSLEGGGF
jgi:hypothetical protein